MVKVNVIPVISFMAKIIKEEVESNKNNTLNKVVSTIVIYVSMKVNMKEG